MKATMDLLLHSLTPAKDLVPAYTLQSHNSMQMNIDKWLVYLFTEIYDTLPSVPRSCDRGDQKAAKAVI